jgi:pyruvate kinase
VANAVLDGTDGILLGAETLRGKYPVETVRTILDICRQAEKVFDHANHFEHLMQVKHDKHPLLHRRRTVLTHNACSRILPLFSKGISPPPPPLPMQLHSPSLTWLRSNWT